MFLVLCFVVLLMCFACFVVVVVVFIRLLCFVDCCTCFDLCCGSLQFLNICCCCILGVCCIWCYLLYWSDLYLCCKWFAVCLYSVLQIVCRLHCFCLFLVVSHSFTAYIHGVAGLIIPLVKHQRESWQMFTKSMKKINRPRSLQTNNCFLWVVFTVSL